MSGPDSERIELQEFIENYELHIENAKRTQKVFDAGDTAMPPRIWDGDSRWQELFHPSALTNELLIEILRELRKRP